MYTVYIDESGEAGIQKVRNGKKGGASPHMTLGATLIKNTQRGHLVNRLEEIQDKISKKHLHCCELNHRKKTYYSRQIGQEDVVLFGVISLKSTLGDYRDDIGGNITMYYHKCAQYLLECVGHYAASNGINKSEIDICFEEGPVITRQLAALIRACQQKPVRPFSKYLQYIDASKIQTKSKADEPILQIADLVAHSLFACADKTNANYLIPEPRYLIELRRRFYRCPKTSKVEGFGVKPIHTLSKVGLDQDIVSIIQRF